MTDRGKDYSDQFQELSLRREPIELIFKRVVESGIELESVLVIGPGNGLEVDIVGEIFGCNDISVVDIDQQALQTAQKMGAECFDLDLLKCMDNKFADLLNETKPDLVSSLATSSEVAIRMFDLLASANYDGLWVVSLFGVNEQKGINALRGKISNIGYGNYKLFDVAVDEGWARTTSGEKVFMFDFGKRGILGAKAGDIYG